MTGYISRNDVLIITVSMRKDFQLVKVTLDKIQALKQQELLNQNMVEEFDEDLVSFGEFATLMWQVEQQQTEAQREEQAARSPLPPGDNNDYFDILQMSTNSPN